MKWHPRKRVLVPVDFSEPAAEAIHTALEFVEAAQDVHTLHVMPPLDHVSPGVLHGGVNDESRQQNARHFLDEYLARNRVEGVTTDVRIGDPGMTISDYVTEHKIDLIVMPSHGYHGLRRILLGSVAERVLRHAECPVLVLRRTDHD